MEIHLGVEGTKKNCFSVEKESHKHILKSHQPYINCAFVQLILIISTSLIFSCYWINLWKVLKMFLISFVGQRYKKFQIYISSERLLSSYIFRKFHIINLTNARRQVSLPVSLAQYRRLLPAFLAPLTWHFQLNQPFKS